MIKFAHKGKIGRISYVMIIVLSQSEWLGDSGANSSIPSFRKSLEHVLPPLLIDKQVCQTLFVKGVEIIPYIVCCTFN
jgi:hypothetical protein